MNAPDVTIGVYACFFSVDHFPVGPKAPLYSGVVHPPVTKFLPIQLDCLTKNSPGIGHTDPPPDLG